MIIFFNDNMHFLHNKNIILIIKYCIISFIYYLYVFSSIYILVDLLKYNRVLSYIIVYTSSYISEYYVNLRVLFNVLHKNIIFMRYIIHIILFTILGSFVFEIFSKFFSITFISLAATIICIFPLRFLSYKLIVYK
jgi:hypothetical protein